MNGAEVALRWPMFGGTERSHLPNGNGRSHWPPQRTIAAALERANPGQIPGIHDAGVSR